MHTNDPDKHYLAYWRLNLSGLQSSRLSTTHWVSHQHCAL